MYFYLVSQFYKYLEQVMGNIKNQLSRLSALKKPLYNTVLENVKSEYDILCHGAKRFECSYFDREVFFERKSTEHKIQLSILRAYCKK